eukprot:scaffold63438_cov57-Phaeocystis_antarctica.AAC.3
MRISRRRAASCCSARSPRVVLSWGTRTAPHPAGTSSTGEEQGPGSATGRAAQPPGERREARASRSRTRTD